jgi:hypothetical protein
MSEHTPDVVAAIKRIEASRQTHVEWAEHLRACDYCREYPPAYVHSAEEQDQIVAEYDNAIACLRSIPDASAQAWARGKWSGHTEDCRAVGGDTGHYRDCVCANPYSVARGTVR